MIRLDDVNRENLMRIRRGLVALFAALVLAGCGGDGRLTERIPPSTSADEADSEPTTAEPSEEPAAPGSTFTYGETARIPVSGDGVMDLTVTSIEPGDPAHFSETGGLGADEDPYYIRTKVVVVSNEGRGISTISLVGVLTAMYGDLHGAEIPTGTGVPQCEYPRVGLLEAGDSFEACTAVAVPTGATVDGVAYAQNGSPYSVWDGKPLVWRP